MWQLMDKNVMTDGYNENAFFVLEYGTENEGIRVTITVPRPMQNIEFARAINNKIKALKALVFANQPENFASPLKQGFDLKLISPPEDNPNSESHAILTARPIQLVETMEQVCAVFGIPLEEANRAKLKVVNDPIVTELQKTARTMLFLSTPTARRPGKYNLMPENSDHMAFYGMEINDKLPEELSKIPEDLTFNTFSYKKYPQPREVVANRLIDIATRDGITLVSAMPLTDSPICGGEHFPFIVENYHDLKSKGIQTFAILIPDIMDSAYRWSQEIIKNASWVKNNPALRDSPTLVEDHFIIITDPTRKIGNYLGIMEPHPRGVYVPHRSSFVIGGKGLILGALKHENPTFCKRDQDPKEQAAPKALVELIAKSKQKHDDILSHLQTPRAVCSM